MYHDTLHAIRIAVCKKSRYSVIKIDSQRQRIGPTEPKIDLVETRALRQVAR